MRRPGHASIALGFAPRAIASIFAGVLAFDVGCARHEPPLAEAGPQASASPLGLARPYADAGKTVDQGVALRDAAAEALATDVLDAATRSDVANANVASVEASEAEGRLPQTNARPGSDDPIFESRARALFDALVHDDPERAMPFFFPRTSYEQVKAIQNPAADWRARLVAAFQRDIHALAREMKPHAATAMFLKLEVPEARARWVEPGEEYNRLGYYRVFGSKLTYEVVGDGGRGRIKSIPVKSLISWRGSWFVVHLSGMR